MATFDPTFTFENFVVGPANRLASAAARRAAERPGVSYNPLFIHAREGLGKTHLLGALARQVVRVSPGSRVEYRTAQEFLEESRQNPGARDERAIRVRYREVDILLLDDVHLLPTVGGIPELLHLTLTVLTGEGKQVVLTSDRLPARIGGLGAHLRTALEAGLLVNIGAPEYETRVAILRKWVEAGFKYLGPGVADAIGRFPCQSVKELRSVLTRVLSVQEMEDRILTPEEATAIIEQGEGADEGGVDAELGQFLHELSDSVAARVQAREAPWRKLLRETAEQAEAEGFAGGMLRRLLDAEAPPADLDGALSDFRERVARLQDIELELAAAGNPWPEAAHAVLRDPHRIGEAEALLASAKERARPFSGIPEGPTLDDLSGALPKLVVRAAEQLVMSDRPEYNPLYVWSPDGAAARVLLHAAGRTRRHGQKGLRTALISIPSFAEEFIRALSGGVAGAWRERWWSVDLLLAERIESLSSTERAQEEFFHLLEALRRRNARVMVAGGRSLGEIKDLDDRLRARLEGGLVLEVPVKRADLPESFRTSLEATPPRELPVEPTGKELGKKVVDEDRAWIWTFKPPTAVDAASRAGDVPEPEEEMAVSEGGVGGSRNSDPWIPSPEVVIWTWPRMEDRIVEELD